MFIIGIYNCMLLCIRILNILQLFISCIYICIYLSIYICVCIHVWSNMCRLLVFVGTQEYADIIEKAGAKAFFSPKLGMNEYTCKNNV